MKSQKTEIIVTSGVGVNARTTKIIIGKDYVVKPRNPRKLKHRDRECTVSSFMKKDDVTNIAIVKFHDNDHFGRVELTRLSRSIRDQFQTMLTSVDLYMRKISG